MMKKLIAVSRCVFQKFFYTVFLSILFQISLSQSLKDVSQYDAKGNKTGLWTKHFENGVLSQEVWFKRNIKYKQIFYDEKGKNIYSFEINPDTIPKGSIILDGGISDQLNPENDIEFVLLKIKNTTTNVEYTKTDTLKNKYILVLPIGSNYEIEFFVLGYLPMKINVITDNIKDTSKIISFPVETLFFNLPLLKSISFDLFKSMDPYFMAPLLYDKAAFSIYYVEADKDWNLEISSREEVEKFKQLTETEKKELTKIALKRIENRSKEVINEIINLKKNHIELENDILKRKNEMILKENETKKQQAIIFSAFGVLLIVVIFSIILFQRFKLINKQKNIIEIQKHFVEEKQKEILDSINYAERIQRSFLATKEILDENLRNYFVYFKPKDVVSGDFYWADKLNNGHFALATADSTGHGVPGAIMSLLNISSLELAIKDGYHQPAEILNQTRQTIINRLKKDGSKEGGKDGMDASLICFDFQTKKMTYATANNPIWIVRNNELIELKGDKMPVGKHDRDVIPFTQYEFELNTGDIIYTLTDGFPDQFGGPKGKKFMYKQLKETLVSISQNPMLDQKETLNSILKEWMSDAEQVDDITIIGIKV